MCLDTKAYYICKKQKLSVEVTCGGATPEWDKKTKDDVEALCVGCCSKIKVTIPGDTTYSGIYSTSLRKFSSTNPVEINGKVKFEKDGDKCIWWHKAKSWSISLKVCQNHIY